MPDSPEYTRILDGLYVGNLSAAKRLNEHPELGITHVLSVCPDYPEDAGESSTQGDTPRIVHRCIPVQDSESEDILIHLPSAVSFIKDALSPTTPCSDYFGNESGPVNETGSEADSRATSSLEEDTGTSIRHPRKNKVLVHCVMGISRSVTVVCAYLMETRRISLEAAIFFVRKRRPQAHPNYGFRRQLAIFAECGYFADQPESVRTHAAHTAWVRKRKREASKYLSRVDNVVEFKLGDEKKAAFSFTDDFPTDPIEASSLLNEIEATHFLTISPAAIPPIPSSPAGSPALRANSRSPPPPSPCISRITSSSTNLSSTSPSLALPSIHDHSSSSSSSSRSSSFSYGSLFSSPTAGSSTAATSVTSLSPPSKLRQEMSTFSDSDEDFYREPNWLEVAGAKHRHLDVSGSSPVDLLMKLSEAAKFIHEALSEDSDQSSESGLSSSATESRIGVDQPHVLIHCTTESRGCAVVCAYLMYSRGMTPEQAYTVLEKALPLFNPTKSFLTQIELFYACECNPTEDHPRIRAWLADGLRCTLSGSPPTCVIPPNLHSTIHRNNAANRTKLTSGGQQDEVGDGSDSDYDECILRRKLGTPMRCGSLAASVAPSPRASLSASASSSALNTGLSSALGGSSSSTVATTDTAEGETGAKSKASSTAAAVAAGRQRDGKCMGLSDLDVDKLLRRCAGVGDPKFTFDVEAFRGALRGIAASASASGSAVVDASDSDSTGDNNGSAIVSLN